MSIQLLLLMGLSLVIVLPIVWIIVNEIDHKDKVKENAGTSLLTKKSKNNILYDMYLFFSRFPITKRYIDQISRKYEVICPLEQKVIAKKTMQVALLTWIICGIAFVGIFILKPNYHNAILGIMLVYVINNEIILYMMNTAEINLLEQMVVFVSNVRHNYHINRMVDDAIVESMDGLNYEMKLHAKRLYEVITSNTIKEDVMKYNATTHNKYLKMFLSLCTSVLDFTDRKVNGQLLFTSNMENLKKEINIEILKQKKLKFVFSGTVFVTMAVCLPIDAIQNFGISMAPSLENFYKGRGGILSVSIIFMSAIIVYLRNNSLKETKRLIPKNYHYLERIERLNFIKKSLDNYIEKNYGKVQILKETLKRIGETISPRQLLLKRMLISIVVLIICLFLSFFMHYSNKYNLIYRVSDIDLQATSITSKQSELMKETILNYTNQYKNDAITEDNLLSILTNEGIFYNTSINERIVKEVITRINKYQNEYFKWYELLICFGVAGVAFQVPLWAVLYKKRVLLLNMEDEVNQFNSIIYMMMYINHITVKDLLEQLELFAIVFKQSIQECINDYNSGDIEALKRLKERENFGPLRRLVDNLIRCDAISIDKAFDEIASDRENYHDRRKQENEISIQKRADIAKTISWIPAVLVTIYLLFPIFYASLKELEGFRESLSMLGF